LARDDVLTQVVGAIRGGTDAISNRRHALQDGTAQLQLADLEQAPAKHPGDEDAAFWLRAIRGALADRAPQSLEIAESGLKACPIDPELLLLAALTATASGQPDRSLALLKRYDKRYMSNRSVTLLTALALGQRGQHAAALTALRAEKEPRSPIP
jgi:predicted Zn-dependent protease